jgi:hypothetical protein
MASMTRANQGGTAAQGAALARRIRPGSLAQTIVPLIRELHKPQKLIVRHSQAAIF